MGIFDYFAPDPRIANLDPGAFGLLQRHPEWQWQQKPSQGFPPIDAPEMNAPISGPAPAQAPVQSAGLSGLFSGVGNGISDNSMMLLALGGGLMQGDVGKAFQLAMAGSAQDEKSKLAKQTQNATINALLKRGLDPETAAVAAANPHLLTSIMQDKLGLAPKTEDIKEFEYAKNQGFDGGFMQWMQRKNSLKGEYGLNPVYGVDKEGKAVILQLGKTGETIQPKLPEGVSISKEPLKLDVGTHFILQDPITRQTIATIPKNIEGKEAAEERGKAMGKAQVNLPNVIAKGEQSAALIDSILADKNLPWATGATSFLGSVPGTATYDLAQKMEQLKGKAFLEAFETLKGGGQITEVEGKKATDAIARLSSAQTTSGYREGLNDLRSVIAAGMESARKSAAMPSPYDNSAPQTNRIRIDANGNIIK